MKKTDKVLIVLQLLLLVIAIVILLLDEATNVFALLFASPFVLVSALLLTGSIIHLLVNRQYRATLYLVAANLLTVIMGCTSIFFTSRLYSDYMLRTVSDTIPYEMIPPRVILIGFMSFTTRSCAASTCSATNLRRLIMITGTRAITGGGMTVTRFS